MPVGGTTTATSFPARARVEGAIDAVRAGRSLFITGAAGHGKSWAVRQVAAALADDGVDLVRTTATASMATVPFGALLALLDGAPDDAPLAVTALALRAALRERSGAVLVVDDAHLLDAPSAGLLHQWACEGVPVVAAARAGEVWPDAIARLPVDAGALELRVEPLTMLETADLLVGVLDGPVDDRLVRVMQDRTGGVPLAVLTLARLGVGASVIRVRGTMRVLDGTLPVSAELGDLVRSSVDGLSDGGRRAAELVALAERIGPGPIQDLDAADPVEECERAGVLRIEADGSAVLAHPLFGDALLAGMPGLRRRRLLGELTGVAAAPVSAVDRVLAARCALELGRAVQLGELLELAELTSTDPRLAELFLRAAIAAGAPASARLRLAELLTHQHRAEESDLLLDDLDRAPGDPATAVAARLTRAHLLVFAAVRADEAFEVLDALPPAPMVTALRAAAELYTGQYAEAAARGAAIALDEAAPLQARAHAALTRATSLALNGQQLEFEAWLPTAWHLVDRIVDEIPEGAEALRLVETLALLRHPLDVRTASRRAVAGQLAALQRGDDGDRGQWAQLAGRAALLAGRADDAVDLCRRAVAADGRWSATNAAMTRSGLVAALVLSGDVVSATLELRALEAVPVPVISRGDVALAAALVAAGRGDLAKAARVAADVGPAGADAWYDAMRYGLPGAAARFLAAAKPLAGASREAQRQHARACADRDPAALVRSSEALELAGLGWFAVDAMAQAVQVRIRLDGRAPIEEERLRVLVGRFPSLRSPLVAALGRPALTRREAEVADLAGAGLTARETAERLGIGVRTVESHLDRVYRKLDIRTRRELLAARDGGSTPARA